MKHERLLVRVEGTNEAADRVRAALTVNPRYVLVDRAPQFVIRIELGYVQEITFDGIHGELESWIATEIQALAGGTYRVAQNAGQNFDDRVVKIICGEQHFEAVQEGVVKGLDRFVQAKWAKKHRIRRWFLYPLLLLIPLLLPFPTATQDVTRKPTGGGGNNTAEYWLGAPDATLTNSHDLDAVANGLVVNTDGVPSQYAGSSCSDNQLVSSLSTAGVATCKADRWVTLHNAGTATGLAPADATPYYWGQFTLFNPSTTSGSQRMTLARACKIVAVRWVTIIQAGTSGENVQLTLRKNDTTDTNIGTQVWTIGIAGSTFTAPTDFTAPTFAIGDDVVLKFQGTWTAAANPTGIIVGAMLYWEGM